MVKQLVAFVMIATAGAAVCQPEVEWSKLGGWEYPEPKEPVEVSERYDEFEDRHFVAWMEDDVDAIELEREPDWSTGKGFLVVTGWTGTYAGHNGGATISIGFYMGTTKEFSLGAWRDEPVRLLADDYRGTAINNEANEENGVESTFFVLTYEQAIELSTAETAKIKIGSDTVFRLREVEQRAIAAVLAKVIEKNHEEGTLLSP